MWLRHLFNRLLRVWWKFKYRNFTLRDLKFKGQLYEVDGDDCGMPHYFIRQLDGTRIEVDRKDVE